MSQIRLLSTAVIFVSLTSAFASRASADTWDKKTEVDFQQRVEVPGAILEPGHYVFKLLNSASNRNIVEVLNQEQNHVYSMMFTASAYRLNIPDRTILTFYEMPAGQPEALRQWFYPGDNYGQEIQYSKQRAQEIALVTSGTRAFPPAPATTMATTTVAPAPPAAPVPPAPVVELATPPAADPQTHSQIAEARPVESAQTDDAQRETSQTEPVQLESAQPEPARPAPMQSKSVRKSRTSAHRGVVQDRPPVPVIDQELPKTASGLPSWIFLGGVATSAALYLRFRRRNAVPVAGVR